MGLMRSMAPSAGDPGGTVGQEEVRVRMENTEIIAQVVRATTAANAALYAAVELHLQELQRQIAYLARELRPGL